MEERAGIRRSHSKIDVEAHIQAPKDIGAAQGWAPDSVQQRGLRLIWLARGRWRTVDNLLNDPSIDRKLFPVDLELYMRNPVNRVTMTALFGKTSALYQLLENAPKTRH